MLRQMLLNVDSSTESISKVLKVFSSTFRAIFKRRLLNQNYNKMLSTDYKPT